MQLLTKYRLTILGAILGGIAGYAYYYFIGCASGTCAITSKPFNSTAYGILMGTLLVNTFKKTEPQTKKSKNNEQSSH
ncbi:MAG: hypothetical protein JSS64_12775 [Bacteroidetes bacterium]|nr:hypothetical protein [Bacteroidota bacterium]